MSAPGASAEPAAGRTMGAGSVQVRPWSADDAQNMAFCLMPWVSSRQNDSPGSSMGMRIPEMKQVPSGARLIDPMCAKSSCSRGHR